MVECIFTIDYEIYGNGTGSFEELIHQPTNELIALFRRWDAKFVAFVEVAEIEMVEAERADKAVDSVKEQIRSMRADGFEIALHLHPQWYNARYHNGRWELDLSEYNLCKLDTFRIETIIDRAIAYLRKILAEPEFVPVSFRAGNWLFHPTERVAKVLAARGVKLDSSVFKGGYQRNHSLDYRPARRNGYYWRFSKDVNVEDPGGAMVEVPIYTELVPFWKMYTRKRVGLQRKGNPALNSVGQRMQRAMDFLRVAYPLKLDFCRMTIEEMVGMTEKVRREDARDPGAYRPLVAIGHTKDLLDFRAIDSFLEYLKSRDIKVCSLEHVWRRIVTLENRHVG